MKYLRYLASIIAGDYVWHVRGCFEYKCSLISAGWSALDRTSVRYLDGLVRVTQGNHECSLLVNKSRTSPYKRVGDVIRSI